MFRSNFSPLTMLQRYQSSGVSVWSRNPVKRKPPTKDVSYWIEIHRLTDHVQSISETLRPRSGGIVIEIGVAIDSNPMIPFFFISKRNRVARRPLRKFRFVGKTRLLLLLRLASARRWRAPPYGHVALVARALESPNRI